MIIFKVFLTKANLQVVDISVHEPSRLPTQECQTPLNDFFKAIFPLQSCPPSFKKKKKKTFIVC